MSGFAKNVILKNIKDQGLTESVDVYKERNATDYNRDVALYYLCEQAGLLDLKKKKDDDVLNINEELNDKKSIMLPYVENMKKSKVGVLSKLTDDQLYMLAFTPSLRDRVKITLTPQENKLDQVTITMDGMLLYDSEETVEMSTVDDEVEALGEVIGDEFSAANNKMFESPIGADCFDNKEVCDGLIDDIKAFGKNCQLSLEKNTKFGHSSSKYRDMQADVERFNSVMGSIHSLSNSKSRAELGAELDRIINTIDRYIDVRHRNDFPENIRDPYVRNRVAAVRKAAAEFKRFKKMFDSADCFYRRKEIKESSMNGVKTSVERKYTNDVEKAKNIPGMKEIVQAAKDASIKMNDIAWSKNRFTDEDKEEVKNCFEKMCFASLKLPLAGGHATTAMMRDILDGGSYEAIVKRVRETKEYHRLFDDPEGITPDLVNTITRGDLELNVRKEFRTAILKEVDAKKAEIAAKAEKEKKELEEKEAKEKAAREEKEAKEKAEAERLEKSSEDETKELVAAAKNIHILDSVKPSGNEVYRSSENDRHAIEKMLYDIKNDLESSYKSIKLDGFKDNKTEVYEKYIASRLILDDVAASIHAPYTQKQKNGLKASKTKVEAMVSDGLGKATLLDVLSKYPNGTKSPEKIHSAFLIEYSKRLGLDDAKKEEIINDAKFKHEAAKLANNKDYSFKRIQNIDHNDPESKEFVVKNYIKYIANRMAEEKFVNTVAAPYTKENVEALVNEKNAVENMDENKVFQEVLEKTLDKFQGDTKNVEEVYKDFTAAYKQAVEAAKEEEVKAPVVSAKDEITM